MKKRSRISTKLILLQLIVILVVGLVIGYNIYMNIDIMLRTSIQNMADVGVSMTAMQMYDFSEEEIMSYLDTFEIDEKYSKIFQYAYLIAISCNLRRLSIYIPTANEKEYIYFFDIQPEKDNAFMGEGIAFPGDITDKIGEGEHIIPREDGNEDGFTVGWDLNPIFEHVPFANYTYIYTTQEIKYNKEDNFKLIIRAEINKDVINNQLYYFTFSLILTLIIFLLVLLIPILIVSKRLITNPIKKLTGYVINYEKGNGSQVFYNTTKTNDELQTLSESFGNMIDDIEAYILTVEALKNTYYKFVPVQFMQYLGRERIADVELGDAKRMHFTVMFCDIRGFSEKSEEMSVLENFEFVNKVFGIMGPIIREHGGFIDKYIGDAIMALFEDCQSAVFAGIKIINSIVNDADTAIYYKGSRIKLGIGVHTGIAMLGIVGENMRLSSTVISKTVNFASRLESVTKQYHTTMIISRESYDLLPEDTKTNSRFLGVVKLAGISTPCEIFEVFECLDEKAKEARLVTKQNFEKAINLYHAGELDVAVEILKTVVDYDNDDQPAKLYLEYILDKIKTGVLNHSIIEFISK